MSRVPTPNIDYTSRDYEAFRGLLIEKLQEKMPEYTDTSETDAGIVILEALANGLDILSLYADITANDVLLPTTQDRRLAVMLAKCLGYTPYNQTASRFKQVFVLTQALSVDTIIPKGTMVKTEESPDLATLYFETMSPLVIPAGNLGDEKDSKGNYLYTVEVENGERIQQDNIGTSTGTPNQKFQLSYTGVLVDTLEVYIDTDNGQELWNRVDSFLDCSETSKVYTVSVDEFDVCTIEFGNGLMGKIPPEVSNGIVADYRIGGGEISNVGDNIITALDDSIPFVDRTFNCSTVALGHDKESLESIKANAPANFRSRDRLVTLRDYEDVVRINFPEFLDLKAIVDTKDIRKVNMYFMLKNGRTMTPDMAERVSAYIADRQMIGTSFELLEYEKQWTDFEVSIWVNNDYKDDPNLVSNVKTYITDVIFKYGEFQFGDSIIRAEIEGEILHMFKDALKSVEITNPSEEITNPAEEYKVIIIKSPVIKVFYV